MKNFDIQFTQQIFPGFGKITLYNTFRYYNLHNEYFLDLTEELLFHKKAILKFSYALSRDMMHTR